jgi:hypothetical protein
MAEPKEHPIVTLLWDSLKRDPEHKDRRVTGWGTKTKVGLIASCRAALIEEKTESEVTP